MTEMSGVVTAPSSVAAAPICGASELIAVLRLIEDASEHGGALIVRGDSGAGKTSLLSAASELGHQRGARVLSVTAAASEAQLVFAGLHQLLVPLLALPEWRTPAEDLPTTLDGGVGGQSVDRLVELPAPQRNALRLVLGLDEGQPPDCFLIGLAVLTLLARATEEGTLVCVIDDAQRLDRASARTLAFVARRLSAERVAMVFATNELGDELTGIAELVLGAKSEPHGSPEPANGPMVMELDGGSRPRKPGATLRDTSAVPEVDPDRTRVVVADDDVLLREGVASLLEQGGYEVVGQAGDGSELIRLVREYRPDLAVIDIRMPPCHRTEGLEAARSIRDQFGDMSILLLSAHVEVAQAMTLLASGRGSGYLLKSRVAALDEFLDAVRRVSRGGSVVDPALVQELVVSREVGDPLAELTPREREVLALIAEGRSNGGISRRLWIAEGTVERHVHSIMMKLGLSETDDDHRRVLAAIRFLDARHSRP